MGARDCGRGAAAGTATLTGCAETTFGPTVLANELKADSDCNEEDEPYLDLGTLALGSVSHQLSAILFVVLPNDQFLVPTMGHS